MTLMSNWFADILRDRTSPVPLKLMLFTKTQEMRGGLRVLAKVVELPLPQRRKWVKEYGNTLQQMSTLLTHQTPFDFEEYDPTSAEFDGDTIKLMGEYTQNLGQFTSLTNTILQSTRSAEARRLASKAESKLSHAKGLQKKDQEVS